MHTIHIVSGGTGASGEHVVRTVLAQFPMKDVTIHISGNVRDAQALETVLNRIDVHRSTVVHTLVSEPMRKQLIAFAERRGLVAFDLVGGMIDRLAWVLERQAAGEPGRYRELRSEYFARMSAIEYAVDHDDGRRAEGWSSGDVLLLGPSRVGKTPLCIYLASLGWKAANLPLVREVEPPPELLAMPPGKVVGLTIKPDRLMEHRIHRAQRLGLSGPSKYEDPLEIGDDVRHARKLFRTRGYSSVDVTDKPIEEIAREVMERVRR